MIERYRVTSPGTLVWECEIRTRDHSCITMAVFFLHVRDFFPSPDMSFNSALRIRQRAEFNLGKVMVISK